MPNLDRYKAPYVKDIMVTKVVAFNPDHSVVDVLKAFNEYSIAAAPVVDKENNLVGFVSEKDCMENLVNFIFYEGLGVGTVESIMHQNVYSIGSDKDIFELEEFLQEKDLRHIPVTDEDNHLVGVVSRRDVLVALEKILNDIVEYKGQIKKHIELTPMEKVKMKVKNED
jgi:CBS domain-containing protein